MSDENIEVKNTEGNEGAQTKTGKIVIDKISMWLLTACRNLFEIISIILAATLLDKSAYDEDTHYINRIAMSQIIGSVVGIPMDIAVATYFILTANVMMKCERSGEPCNLSVMPWKMSAVFISVVILVYVYQFVSYGVVTMLPYVVRKTGTSGRMAEWLVLTKTITRVFELGTMFLGHTWGVRNRFKQYDCTRTREINNIVGNDGKIE
jgi:hypothetical protein